MFMPIPDDTALTNRGFNLDEANKILGGNALELIGKVCG
jgi:hypothetical protein